MLTPVLWAELETDIERANQFDVNEERLDIIGAHDD
jgi:hypothetical protein